jgi:hypothetical protein
MLRSIRVRKYLIDFAGLQGNLVTLVFQAHNKLLGWCLHGDSIKVAFDLELSAPNAVSFIPVYLRQPGDAIRKSHTGDTLSLPPAATPVELAQSSDFSNGRADRKRLDMGDCPNDLEVH